MKKLVLRLSCLALMGVSLSAQTPCFDDIFIHVGHAATPPTNSVPVVRLADLNRDGIAQSGTELFPFQRKWFSTKYGKSFITDMNHNIENGRIVYYFTDSDGTGGECFIIRSMDKNGDGIIQDIETMVWATFTGPTSGYSPDSVALFTDYKGNVAAITAHDATGLKGLHKSVDLNKDGDALDAGETTVWANGASNLTVAATAGPVSLSFSYMKRVRANAAGCLLAFDPGSYTTATSDRCAWYSFKEDSLGKVSAKNFFNASALNKLDRNPEFASGKIADIDITWNTAANNICDINLLAIGKSSNGNDVYFFATPYSTKGSWGAVNKANQPVNGLVFRGEDLNKDGDLNDMMEVSMLYNGSGKDLPGGTIVGNVKSPNYYDSNVSGNTNICDGIWGIAAVGEVVYIMHAGSLGQTGDKSILRLEDKNRNRIIDPGEIKQIFNMQSPWPNFWSTTYGPYVLGIHAVPAYAVPDPQPAEVTSFGSSCLASTGLEPLAWSRGGAPILGNSKFELLVSRGAVNSPGLLLVGSSKTSMGPISLPFGLGFIGATGCALNTNMLMTTNVVLDASGVAVAGLPIPSTTALKGASFHGQFMVVDAKANPAGLIATNGVTIAIK